MTLPLALPASLIPLPPASLLPSTCVPGWQSSLYLGSEHRSPVVVLVIAARQGERGLPLRRPSFPRRFFLNSCPLFPSRLYACTWTYTFTRKEICNECSHSLTRSLTQPSFCTRPRKHTNTNHCTNFFCVIVFCLSYSLHPPRSSSSSPPPVAPPYERRVRNYLPKTVVISARTFQGNRAALLVLEGKGEKTCLNGLRLEEAKEEEELGMVEMEGRGGRWGRALLPGVLQLIRFILRLPLK